MKKVYLSLFLMLLIGIFSGEFSTNDKITNKLLTSIIHKKSVLHKENLIDVQGAEA